MIKKINAVATATEKNAVLTVPKGTEFDIMSRYDFCITNPIPVAGYGLPLVIIVECDDVEKKEGSEDKKEKKTEYPVVRFGLGDDVFGCNEKHSKCIRTYFNNESEFVDLRIKEYTPYCNCDCE